MEPSADSLRERYSNLSDKELMELHWAGTITPMAETVLIEEVNKRGLSLDNMDNNVGAETVDSGEKFINSSPPPRPKLWVGFLIAGLALLASFYDISEGYTKAGIRTPILMAGTIYWLFCVDRFHRILIHISSGTYKISPKTAAIFHLIPFFNIYWIIRWPTEFSRFISKDRKTKMLPGWLLGVILLLFILMYRVIDGPIALFGIFSLFLYMSSKLGKQVLLFEAERVSGISVPYEGSHQEKWF